MRGATAVQNAQLPLRPLILLSQKGNPKLREPVTAPTHKTPGLWKSDLLHPSPLPWNPRILEEGLPGDEQLHKASCHAMSQSPSLIPGDPEVAGGVDK